MLPSRWFPELQHFPDEQAAPAALLQTRARILQQPGHALLLAGLILAAAVLIALVVIGLKWRFRVDATWLAMLSGVLAGGIGVAIAQFKLRRPMQRDLRRQPVNMGIPVCTGCGYDLRGNTSGRCPECGVQVHTSDASEPS